MIGLSVSSLSLFRECPRCFWLDKNRKVKRPRGIFPSLPKGMDRVMKAQVESLIATSQEIPALAGIVGATPFRDRERMKKFRSWRTFQREIAVEGMPITVWGELDDLIEHEDGSVSPWDFKTKGDEPDAGYGEKYYQNQLDTYHLILEGNALKCTGKGYLSYGWPEAIVGTTVLFGWKNLILDTDPGRSVEIVTAAVICLTQPEPRPAPDCEMCAYVSNRRIIENDKPPKLAKVSKR